MKIALLGVVISAACLLASGGAQAHQDVCSEAQAGVLKKVDADYAQWIASIQGLPPEIQAAYKTIFDYNRSQTYVASEMAATQCDGKFETPQQVVDYVIEYYTAGLSKALPPSVTHVDVSELMSGKPLGGPNAAVPKLREQILTAVGGGGNGTGANIIRDPVGCITFAHQC